MFHYEFIVFFFQAEDGIRDGRVTGVQTCALPIWPDAAAQVRNRFEAARTGIPVTLAALKRVAEAGSLSLVIFGPLPRGGDRQVPGGPARAERRPWRGSMGRCG